MRREKKVKVGKNSYTIKEFPPLQRNIILFKVSRILGAGTASISGILNTLGSWWRNLNIIKLNPTENIENKNLGEIDLKIHESIQGILNKIEPEEAADLIQEIIVDSVVNLPLKDTSHPTDSYEEHFARYYDNQWGLIYEIFIFNYRSSAEILLKKKFFPKGKTIQKFFQELIKAIKQ